MSKRIGYVVIEFNQASGQPDLATDDLHSTEDEAAGYVGEFTAEARHIGRREKYAVGTVYIEES